MQKFLGLVLLMSGLAMAALWLPSRDGNGRLAQVIEIGQGGIARVGRPDAPEAVSANPSEAQGRPTVAAVSSPPAVTSSIGLSDAAAPARSPARGSSASGAGTARSGSQTGIANQVVVTNASVESAPETRLGSPQPATEDAYYTLVRDLQRELRRLGCYWGEVDGSWGPGTKRALGTLMAKVNASLPHSEPDYILLALARSQSDQACRRPCPPEQVLVSDTGQCLPRALVRHAAGGQAAGGHADDANTAPGQDTASATPYAALPGQMAIGGPRPGIDGGPDAALAVQRPRPPTTLYRYSEPRRDNSWKRRVFGENLYGR